MCTCFRVVYEWCDNFCSHYNVCVSHAELVCHEDIITELAADTVYSGACLGVEGSRFNSGSFAEIACLELKVCSSYPRCRRWWRGFQTAHLWANAGGVQRVALSRLGFGVHDRLHIYPLCGIFYFPWHRDQIEGTDRCLIRKTQTSLMLRARFLHLKCNLLGPGIEPRSPACQAGVLTTTLPLCIWVCTFGSVRARYSKIIAPIYF